MPITLPGLAAGLLLSALTSTATAQIVEIGGPLRPGQARPPVVRNAGPFSTSSAAAP